MRMNAKRINNGCSGWYYWHWKGVVYPAELSDTMFNCTTTRTTLSFTQVLLTGGVFKRRGRRVEAWDESPAARIEGRLLY